MFELEQQSVKLASVNARAEIHGEDRKSAFDLKIEAQLTADILAYFHPELRNMLYKKAENPDLVEQVEPESASALRFPKMGAIKWDWEATGYTVRVDYGMGGDSDIILSDCKIDNFRIQPMNGGTVNVLFRVICHPATDDVGRLCDRIQQNIEITIEPPEALNVDDLFKAAA